MQHLQNYITPKTISLSSRQQNKPWSWKRSSIHGLLFFFFSYGALGRIGDLQEFEYVAEWKQVKCLSWHLVPKVANLCCTELEISPTDHDCSSYICRSHMEVKDVEGGTFLDYTSWDPLLVKFSGCAGHKCYFVPSKSREQIPVLYCVLCSAVLLEEKQANNKYWLKRVSLSDLPSIGTMRMQNKTSKKPTFLRVFEITIKRQ